MEKADIEELRSRVGCDAVLETGGFAIDLKESTRKAMKYRRADDIIIVIHNGKGWFDPLSDAKGDVYSLVQHLDGCDFLEAFVQVGSLVGFEPREPEWKRQSPETEHDRSIPDRWAARRKPRRGSATWRYLRYERHIPEEVIRAAIAQNLLREGPCGSMWAAHQGANGAVTGWEERGPEWRGFATGGSKVLFRFGFKPAARICVTEAAIDAMSLAAIEKVRHDTLYVSTGGGWSLATDGAIRLLGERPDARLVAATDANTQGEAFVSRLRELAGELSCDFERLKPLAEDWNAMLTDAAIP
ncbi:MULTISPECIES: DUF3991 and toprim domain-containing protein [unclassified Mesorhizobium]|uniref:DUF3991 and toprim domain-containing protein n=1 Tax=unclassified Mesorhizobium TaxID=325217 RepID=UPI0011278FD2|nr:MULTISPECIES: DUF3991 and toprim domain-containing protein [unclassified Mesorhizobium]MBZ9985203.1 DUF3991 and toprim domain-containing protein [Mesorhizobium sp. BR-1-1-8]TPL26849.1 DUF3991 domain-containing protein [Mesorhizobium sp. B2-4-8]TPL58101.1 DUF3991 domain-containing protein [Mesorhizobium sp. B2-4-1]